MDKKILAKIVSIIAQLLNEIVPRQIDDAPVIARISLYPMTFDENGISIYVSLSDANRRAESVSLCVVEKDNLIYEENYYDDFKKYAYSCVQGLYISFLQNVKRDYKNEGLSPIIDGNGLINHSDILNAELEGEK